MTVNRDDLAFRRDRLYLTIADRRHRRDRPVDPVADRDISTLAKAAPLANPVVLFEAVHTLKQTLRPRAGDRFRGLLAVTL
jgi:hypothetical protein